MNIGSMTDEQYALLFAVRRSIRYHEQRAAFFERLHQLTGALTVFLAGTVILDFAGPAQAPAWLAGLALIAAVLAAFDFVVGYAKAGALHRTLKARFAFLELAILQGDSSEAAWAQHGAERLKIEQDEPAVYRALDLACHNELLDPEGHGRDSKHRRQIGRIEYLTRHFLHWPHIAA